MGIGNTTPAAAISTALCGGSAEKWTGRGTGVDDAGLKRKVVAIEAGLKRHVDSLSDPLKIAAALGGRELAAIFGATLAARKNNVPVLLDGFVCTAAAAPLARLHPTGLAHTIAAHVSAEAGHRRLLEALGLPPLRQLLARRMTKHGVEASPDQIMLTDCGTQAIDLLCRFLIEPGDAVLVDDPCYFNFHALLRAHQAKVVGVPYTPSGPDIELFAAALAEHRPRLYITNSGIHNPTGAILSPVAAHRLLKLADQADLTIVEDDIFADFEHSAAPRLAAFDGLQRVVQIGSFAKTLSASVRCGFIAAPPDWMEGLTDLKIATTFGGARLSAELVLTLLKDGSYRKHVEQLRTRLSRAMAETAGRLKTMGITPWIDQPAGMFLWCRLPDGIDAAEVACKALSDNVVLAPGNAFSLSHTAGRFMRFNVAQCEDQRIFRALNNAMAASRRKAA
ncbi:MAG: aminotransferase class I/II-fold pyridoxal phosphate-dependent enzyme [Mesorhizobium sp.]|nr:MAG: aminotransferase class I/II-fold pyridoxal phosphate-dependent enzyme [Mesorhizobium sp.]